MGKVITYNKYIHLRCEVVQESNRYVIKPTGEDDCFYGMSAYRNKMILIGNDGAYGRCTPFDWESTYNSKFLRQDMQRNPGQRYKIYIVPECGRPRDIYRKDFDIVRSRDDADVIVIPRPLNYISESCYGDTYTLLELLCKDTTKDDAPYRICYEMSISGDINSGDSDYIPFLEESMDLIEDWVKKMYPNLEIAYHNFHVMKSFGLVKDIQEYKEIYENDKLVGKRYIYEDDMPVDAPNKLNAETLAIIWRSQDDEVTMKYLAACNWTEYPFTAYKFIKAKYDDCRYRSSNLPRALKNLFDTLKHYASQSTELVSAEDYSLFQDFVFKIWGVDGKGFVTMDEWNNIKDKEFADYLPVRIAIKKIKPDAPVRVCDLNKQ